MRLRCEIFLKAADNSLRLILRDEGRGFDPVEVRKKPGLGLSSMRERVQLVRGEFSITPILARERLSGYLFR